MKVTALKAVSQYVNNVDLYLMNQQEVDVLWKERSGKHEEREETWRRKGAEEMDRKKEDERERRKEEMWLNDKKE